MPLPLRSKGPRRPKGFTLVEALVTLVMLSMVALGLAGSMHTIGQAQTRLAARQARLQAMETTSRVLQQLLGEPVRETLEPARDAPGWPQRRIRFSLKDDAIEWVGVMPPRPGMGGPAEFRLALEQDSVRAGVRHLVLRHRPRAEVNQGVKFDSWDSAQAETLAAEVQALRIQVRSERPAGWSVNMPWDDAWRPDWPEWVRDVPQWIRIELADALGPWPPIMIAVRPTPPSAARLQRAVIGGGQVD
ncbi:hypothetical protein Talka_01085 [Tepidimonas alkaliphilus]|uniref:Type II secretion system protein J n=1 Tax=Tepidimonas alkaliphilus TaxID=2588942 RepID=A0A554W9E6_9BURK|nr:prepilin-type N-terminal cleavage/methylation domain-containing protein [Tepidimonas alkaliphilus]TSE20190.1 hypothetical protein Talka_01085 [Tepidimonas alkaliphilus]